MKKFVYLFLIFILLAFAINPSQARMMPKVSKDRLQNMQTEYFDNANKKDIMQAVVATLYDSDYIIEDYDYELGIIRAKKIFKAAYTSKKRVAGWSFVLAAATAYTVFSYGATAASMYSPSRRIATEFKDKTVVIDANVFVEEVDNNKIKVHFLPVEKVLQNADGFAFNQMAPIKIIRIYKPQAYNEFFTQIQKNLI